MRTVVSIAALSLALTAPLHAQIITSPAPGAVVGPRVQLVATAPPGTRTTTFCVDEYEVGRFPGAGEHRLERSLDTPGPRRLVVRCFAPDGRLLGKREQPFVARGLELRVSQRQGRLDLAAVAHGYAPAQVRYYVDQFLLGEAAAAPWSLGRTLSRGGRRQVRAVALDGAGRELARAERSVWVASPLEPPAARGAVRALTGWAGRRVKLSERTISMLRAAGQWLAENGGCPPSRTSPAHVVQGSYHPGVSASAGTHDGGGVLDMEVSSLTAAQRARLVRALREAGFAAWQRVPPAFGLHIHAVAIGDPDLSAGARAQVSDYFRGRDGLAGHRPDPHGGPILAPWMQAHGAPAPGASTGISGRLR
ncbi:MAG: hypothetical protein AB7N76_03765 [Planctomycetota bacterium]